VEKNSSRFGIISLSSLIFIEQQKGKPHLNHFAPSYNFCDCILLSIVSDLQLCSPYKVLLLVFKMIAMNRNKKRHKYVNTIRLRLSNSKPLTSTYEINLTKQSFIGLGLNK
jgi:hypothetical protein